MEKKLGSLPWLRMYKVGSININDMKEYLNKWERPDGAILGLVGDFDADDMLELVRAEFGDWAPGQESEPSAEVLKQAKDTALNGFVFNFADTNLQLARIMSYDFFGIPEDFIYRYRDELEGTTSSDVLHAARRHLHVGEQPIVVVADARTVREELESLGMPVRDLQLKIL
eukprot:jgi/Pico_ML_1/54470/g4812.t1